MPTWGGGGGQLQSVRMRPTPQLSIKTWGGSWGGVGGRGGGGGGGSSAGGGGGLRALPHAYLKGVCVSGGMGGECHIIEEGLRVWGHGGIEVCMRY